MITSLGRSTARATARSAGHVCLRCRANHQLVAEGFQRDAATPPALPSTEGETAGRHVGGKNGISQVVKTKVGRAWRAAKEYMAQNKLVEPRFVAHVDGDNGHKVSLELDGKTFETSLYENPKMARRKAKLLAIEYLQSREAADRQLDKALFAVLQNQHASAPQTTVLSRRHQPSRRVRLRRSPSAHTKRARSPRQRASREAARAGEIGKLLIDGPKIRTIWTDRTKTAENTAENNADTEASLQHQTGDGSKLATAKARLIGSRAALYERVKPSPLTGGLSRVHKTPLLRTSRPTNSADSMSRARAQGEAQSALKGKGAEEMLALTSGSLEEPAPFKKFARASARTTPYLKLSENARTFEPLGLEKEILDVPKKTVPSLSYGLDRVLFNPGVYHVQDPRSRVYNFDPYLQKIVHPKNFDFASVDEFKSPSADSTLSSVAEKHKAKYFSSTSAITGVLSHLHYLLSGHRSLCFENLSAGFLARRGASKLNADMKGDFTTFFKSPQSIYLKPKQGGYAIDKAEDKSSSNLLSFVGHCLEKLFTVPKEVFEQYKKGPETKPQAVGNAYHYTKFDSVLVRSQLDAHDNRLPGTGMFDIKTRAVLPLRMDTLEANQKLSTSYEIKNLYGEFESFEREFHDMSRATMLKYSLQARLGRMDGIFVAFHNVARIFGFQYLSLSDMDKILHGQADTVLGDAELSGSFRILTEVFNNAVKLYPDEPLRLYFETRKTKGDMLVYVVPVESEEIEQQHENAQRVSREYLARLNKSSRETIEEVQEELQAIGGKLEQSFEATSEGSSWLNVSETERNSEEQDDAQDLSLESVEKDDDFGEEVGRLSILAAGINRETETLRSEGIREDKAKIQKAMLVDIAKKTFSLEKGIDDLAAQLPPNGETSDVADDLRTLRKQLDEQKQENEELYKLGEQNHVVSGSEIKDLTSSRTLEEALQAATRRYTAPERMSAFKVKVQSSVDGTVLTEPPTHITKESKWELTYVIDDFRNQEDLQDLFVKMLKRQDQAPMSSWESHKLRQYYDGSFFGNLMRLSREGRKYRQKLDKEDAQREVVVFEPKAG